MYILKLSFFWSLLVGGFGYTTYYDTDMIVNLTLSFASAYDTSCIRMLSKSGRVDDHSTFEIYKRISVRLQKTAAVYSYDQYVEATKRKLMRRTCFKPIKLIIDGEGTKDKFVAMSRQIRMAESLWLIILNRTIPEFLTDAYLPFDIQLIVAEVKNKDLVEFHEAYRVDKDYPLRICEFGKWTRSEGLDIPRTHLYERRTDLEGKLLRAGSIENWPMSTFRHGQWDGYFPRIWKEVAAMMNSTTEAYRSRDNATGSIRRDGSWSGLIGMILDGSIDVIAAEITINRERSRYVSFTRPVLMTRYKIYFTSTGRLLKWDAAFKPFRGDIWLAVLIWVVVGTISMALCYNFSWCYGLDSNTRKMFDLTESFFFVLQSLCQQGHPAIPRSTACRIVILSCFLVSSVLIPSYSAAVISSLTFENQDKPFDTLQEMLDRGTHKLLVIPNSGQFDHFKHSTNPLNQAVLNKLIRTVPREYQVRSIHEALEKVFCKLNKYAFFSTQKVFEMKIQYSPVNCPIVTLTEELAPVYQSLVLGKHSPFRGIINHHLQKLFDIGIINRIENSIRKIQTHNFKPMFIDVHVEDAFQIFLLFSVGVFFSVIILLSEKIYSTFKHKDDALRK